ncbi:DEAD/DEAH box helicase [Beijerinckia sp. L45]|uniref:DEAD/DEAH box helicase n=1 Tax=Beijerinckia sp. L45 TaxID=1641855 RepID=UPI00131C83E9|nr:DEAD/DEAH box helicase [Beijerinckia sp. L45]
MTQFTDLGLSAPILKALESENYVTPTPIQAQAIPHVLLGKDLLGIAQTGTGKTAAFALPILHRLSMDRVRPEKNTCRALILSPTRELASQIAESFRVYGKNLGLSIATVFGGVSIRPQIDRLMRGVDILVATPGRLIDHLDQRTVRLDHVEIFVLDEADQMLDMGFIHAIRRLTPLLPKARQSLFFSATMPKEIGLLAGDLLRDPVKVSVTPVSTTAERVDQRVIFIETARKRHVLADLIRQEEMNRGLVFTRTKHGADKVVRHLEEVGIPALAIHGNKSQAQRERALASFKNGATKILVATDIAARGIDVDMVTHVVNFDLPNVPESYVHRIGRTARAGATGQAISLCDIEERGFLKSIEKLTRQTIPSEDRRDPRGAAANPEPREDARPPRQYDRASERRGSGGPGRPAFDHKHGAGGQNRAAGDRPASSRPRPAGGRPPARSNAGSGAPRRPS